MSSDETKPASTTLITVIVVTVIIVLLVWKFLFSESESVVDEVIIVEPAVVEAPVDIEPLIEEPIKEVPIDFPVEDAPELETITTVDVTVPEVISYSPALDESDSWVQEKLSSIIWRKELLELLIDEDMIRRFVVFVDNFSQGTLVYSHSPFIKPSTSFIVKQSGVVNGVDTESQLFEMDEANFKRFSLYVELFKAVNTETLMEWYNELQPLIEEAYSELGYPDKKFEEVLQDAITKVLDVDFPKDAKALIRPSVMYQYKSSDLEELDDAEKLMLRIGKDNLLIIKSVLIEINEKLNQDKYNG